LSVRSEIDRRVAAGLGRRRSIRGRGAHSSVAFEPLWWTVAGYLMACSAQAANCQTTWLIPSAPSSSSKPHRNRQRDREHVMRPELQYDAARAPHRLRPPIAFKVSQQPMMDTAASIAGYND
jgi:hypothetical protein